MLRAGPEVDAHRLRLRQIVALGVRVHQRAAPLPVFRGRLRVQDERVRLRPLQDRVGLAGEMVLRGGV